MLFLLHTCFTLARGRGVDYPASCYNRYFSSIIVSSHSRKEWSLPAWRAGWTNSKTVSKWKRIDDAERERYLNSSKDYYDLRGPDTNENLSIRHDRPSILPALDRNSIWSHLIPAAQQLINESAPSFNSTSVMQPSRSKGNNGGLIVNGLILSLGCARQVCRVIITFRSLSFDFQIGSERGAKER